MVSPCSSGAWQTLVATASLPWTRSSVFNPYAQGDCEGVSFVLVTHKVREVRDCADRFVVVRDGHVVAQGARSEFDHERLVAELAGSTGDAHRSKSRAQESEVERLDIRGDPTGP